MKTSVMIAGAPVTVEVVRRGDEVDALVGGTRYRARVSRGRETWSIALPDHTIAATVVRERDAVWVAIGAEIYRCVAVDEARTAGASGAHSPRITAPMPGKVLDVRVAEGQPVAAGDVLVVLEAMKMETSLTADAAGRVSRVHVAVGAMVEPGQTLIELVFADAKSDG